MSPSDVPAWLKSLRLHKYAGLFSTMTYDEMMSLTEQQLEAQVGAFIALHCYTSRQMFSLILIILIYIYIGK